MSQSRVRRVHLVTVAQNNASMCRSHFPAQAFPESSLRFMGCAGAHKLNQVPPEGLEPPTL